MDVVVLRMVEEEVEDGSDLRRIALDDEAPGRLVACSDLERDAGMSRETSPRSSSKPSARAGEQGRKRRSGWQMRRAESSSNSSGCESAESKAGEAADAVAVAADKGVPRG